MSVPSCLVAPCLLLYYILYVTQKESPWKKKRVRYEEEQSREDKLKKQTTEYAPVALPSGLVFLSPTALVTSCPSQLIIVLRDKRDNQKEEEEEEEESRENKETREYVAVGPICPLVLRIAVDVHVSLIPSLGRGGTGAVPIFIGLVAVVIVVEMKSMK